MFLVMYLLSILLFGLAMFLAADTAGKSIGMYYDITSLILVFFPTIFLTIASYSFKDFSSAFKNLFRDSDDKILILNSISIFDQLKNLSTKFGWIGAFIGWIIMLFGIGTYKDFPENFRSLLALSFGVSILPIFYGYLISSFIFEPLKNMYIKKLNKLQ